VKCETPKTRNRHIDRRFGYRELEESRVETLQHKSPEVSKCKTLKIPKQAHQPEFWIPKLEESRVKTLHHRSPEVAKCKMRNAETPFCVDFGYREMERQKTSSQGMSECRNAEMRKTTFGVGFRYRELECRNTLQQECRNDETPKCVFK
jgi:hypothetical protein